MNKNHKKYISFEQSSKIFVRQTSLTKNLHWAHYQNDYERLSYANNKQHTLSMYLTGGFETHRTDIKADHGAPGKFCLMPKGSESQWQVGSTQQFMHLYFDDRYLKKLALKTFDIDPRTLMLPELTFFENKGLEAMFRYQMAASDWQSSSNHLALEQVTDTILVSMLQSLGKNKFNPQIRIDQVKNMCKNKELPLLHIALACGFSNSSHMGRYFKKLTGISPGEYRKYL